LEKNQFMKHIWMIFAIAALVLTACGPTPEPTMSPADVQGTAMAAAMTMVAETQAAIPTATPIPPTELPTATPFPTSTVPPLILETPTLAQGVSVFPTNTRVPASGSGSNDPCNQPLTSWGGESAKLTLKNHTKPQGVVTASLFFNASFGECGYISAQFSSSTTLTVPRTSKSSVVAQSHGQQITLYGSKMNRSFLKRVALQTASHNGES
jgi:hypothetical protein